MSDYQPLNCDLHDELEVAALRGRPVTLRWRDDNDRLREATGIIRSIVAIDGEEFLQFAAADELLRLRLDQILLDSFPLR